VRERLGMELSILRGHLAPLLCRQERLAEVLLGYADAIR
jgi:hypothetical protein